MPRSGSCMHTAGASRSWYPISSHLQNRILTFYADAVTESPLKGVKALLDLLGPNRTGTSSNRDRDRSRSIATPSWPRFRAPVGKPAVTMYVMPRLVLPEVMERLRRSERRMRRQLTTAT